MPLQEPVPRLDDSTGEHQPVADPDPPRVGIKFGALSDTGKVRGNNEDHFLVARLSKSMQVCKTSLPGEGKTRSPRKRDTSSSSPTAWGAPRPANSPAPWRSRASSRSS